MKKAGVIKDKSFNRPLEFLKKNNYTLRLINKNDREEFLNKSDFIFRTDEPISGASGMEVNAWRNALDEIMEYFMINLNNK